MRSALGIAIAWFGFIVLLCGLPFTLLGTYLAYIGRRLCRRDHADL